MASRWAASRAERAAFRDLVELIDGAAFRAPYLGKRFERDVEPDREPAAVGNRASNPAQPKSVSLDTVLLDAEVEDFRRDSDHAL